MESEKLSVARDDRNIPKSSRENDFISWYCWCVGLKYCVITPENTTGKATLKAEKAPKTYGSICQLVSMSL